MTAEEIKAEVERINWFHQIDLGHGIVTPGVDESAKKLEKIGLPPDLKGRSVLDIGAWNGFFSFESERRGADRVVALDSYCWGGEGPGTKEGFDLVKRVLGSSVEELEMDLMDLDPGKVGQFDLVLFLGVLYHMRHPLLSLERVAAVTRGQLILETHVDLLDLKRPAMAFYPGVEVCADSSNWWGPNPPAVKAMLESVGFQRVEMVDCSRGPVAQALRKLRPTFKHRERLVQGRAVFHAYKD